MTPEIVGIKGQRHNVKRSKTKSGSKQVGFTIVETMIVLAVTGVMFSSVVLMISGKQRTTEFQTAVADVRTRIQQLSNEVASGYFPEVSGFGCERTADVDVDRSGFKPRLVPSGANTGQCVFLGKVLHFYNNASGMSNQFSAYSVIGLASDEGTYNAAKPFLVANSPDYNFEQNPGEADVTTNSNVPYGLNAAWMTHTNANGSDAQEVGSFGFMQSLNQGGSVVTEGGAGQSVNLIGFRGSGGGGNSSLANNQVAEANALNRAFESGNIFEGGVVMICFNSGGTDQHAVITIGANGSQLSVTSQIKSNQC